MPVNGYVDNTNLYLVHKAYFNFRTMTRSYLHLLVILSSVRLLATFSDNFLRFNGLKTETHDLVHAQWSRRKSISSVPSADAPP